MNYLEVCGIILHASIALCILVCIFAIRNATDYNEQDYIKHKAPKNDA